MAKRRRMRNVKRTLDPETEGEIGVRHEMEEDIEGDFADKLSPMIFDFVVSGVQYMSIAQISRLVKKVVAKTLKQARKRVRGIPRQKQLKMQGYE